MVVNDDRFALIVGPRQCTPCGPLKKRGLPNPEEPVTKINNPM